MLKLRFDRALSVGVAHPLLPLVNKVTRPLRVPILMYHGIRKEAGSGHPYFETHTSPQVFSAHMHYLKHHGYHAISVSEAAEAMEEGVKASKAVVITFDDGYHDFYTNAYPILMEYGFSATVFIISGLMQDVSGTSTQNKYMGWDKVREVHGRGIEIGSHTVTHPKLEWLNPELIDDELELSKQMIEERLGEAIQSFSCPYAFPEHRCEFARMLRSRLRAHGYQNAVTTIVGTAGPACDRFQLPRLPINSYDDLKLFEAKLEGAYNWLHSVQLIWKFLHFYEAA
jgi:peptidoglycan/xylan/chitin deacetylase (PgdA/CDA1 family)